MTDVFKIAEILVNHATRVHAGEIAIIAYYGSHAQGRATPSSDLDIYYVPDEGKAASLSSQFIIDGLPYDFWGVPWWLLEGIVDGISSRPWAVAAALVADTRVLHHRSDADLERFKRLKARVAELTRPESRQVMVGRALEGFKTALFQLGQMRLALAEADLAGLRWAGRQLVHSAINCLALVNQTYFSRGWGANMAEVLALEQRPPDLERLIDAVLAPHADAEMLGAAESLTREVREILRAAQGSLAQTAPVGEVFRDFYYYVLEYRNKVLSACGQLPPLNPPPQGGEGSAAPGAASSFAQGLLDPHPQGGEAGGGDVRAAASARSLVSRPPEGKEGSVVPSSPPGGGDRGGWHDVHAAASAAAHMQEQICQLMHKVHGGFYGTDFNLLGEYSSGYYEAGFPDLLEPARRGDLATLAQRVIELDTKMRAWLARRDIPLNILEDEDDLRRFLNQRDPAE
jgi:hypothetical protein